MLAGVGRLVEGHRRFPLDQENIEVLGQKNCHRFPHGSDDPAFHIVHRIDNIESTVLEDRIGVQNEESGFHDGK